MFKKSICIILIASFIFYTSCASVISEVPVKESEYDDIKTAEKIFITSKDGKEHEIIQFEFTETNLVGKEIFSSTGITKTIEISLSDIKDINVMGVRDNKGEIIIEEEIEMNITTNTRHGFAVLGALIFGAIVFLPLYNIETEVGMEKETKMTLTFCLIEFPFLLFGGLLGYKIGKNIDNKKAIEKIKKEREQEREKEDKDN